MASLAEQLLALASAIDARRPDADIAALLQQVSRLCERASAAERSAAVRETLTRVQRATQAWQQVWHRLSEDREFRLAVAREARLWSRRLA